MAKRLIKPDGLWTPPHVRRERPRKAFAPPRAVGGISPRFLNRRCCCGGTPCILSSDCFSVTCSTLSDIVFTISGVTNDLCGNCTDFNGTFTASNLLGGCSWGYETSPVHCDPRTGSEPNNSVSAGISCVGGVCILRVNIIMREDRDETTGDWRETHQFGHELPSGQLYQNGSNYDLTYAATFCQVYDFFGGGTWDNQCAAGIKYECDFSGASFNVDFNAP